MGNKRSFEYDAFGPWVYEIDKTYTLPPLYKSYQSELDHSFFAVKIPRNIDRVEANPSMDLYDMVILLFTDRILFLERQGAAVCESSISYDSIRRIKSRECLLCGELTFFTEKDKSFLIRYNRVSEKIIYKLTRLIREKMGLLRDSEMELPDALEYNLQTMEYGYVRAADIICQANPHTRLLAYQPAISYKVPLELELSILNRLCPKEPVICSFIVLGNPKELILCVKGYYPRRASTENHAYTTFYYPWDQLEDINICKEMELSKLRIQSTSGLEELVTEHAAQGLNPLIQWSAKSINYCR